jgi:hypothetical protein
MLPQVTINLANPFASQAQYGSVLERAGADKKRASEFHSQPLDLLEYALGQFLKRGSDY